MDGSSFTIPSETPCAEPHAGWCGSWGLDTPGYPIRCHVGSLLDAKLNMLQLSHFLLVVLEHLATSGRFGIPNFAVVRKAPNWEKRTQIRNVLPHFLLSHKFHNMKYA